MAMVHRFSILFVFNVFCSGTTNSEDDRLLFTIPSNPEISQLLQPIQYAMYETIVQKLDLDAPKKETLELIIRATTAETILQISNKISAINTSHALEIGALNAAHAGALKDLNTLYTGQLKGVNDTCNELKDYAKEVTCAKRLRYETEIFKNTGFNTAEISTQQGKIHKEIQKMMGQRYNNFSESMGFFHSISCKYEIGETKTITIEASDFKLLMRAVEILQFTELEVPEMISTTPTTTEMTSTELEYQNIQNIKEACISLYQQSTEGISDTFIKQIPLWQGLDDDFKRMVALKMTSEIPKKIITDRFQKEQAHKQLYVDQLIKSGTIWSIYADILDQKNKECLGVFYFTPAERTRKIRDLLKKKWKMDESKCIDLFCIEFSRIHEAVSSEFHGQRVLQCPKGCQPSTEEFREYIGNLSSKLNSNHVILVAEILNGKTEEDPASTPKN
ncbi:uncharacterized protein LOC135847065 [Planococcus citri]|uniref:uncharacterized protein LOC135847065 n=1 Tax=Planococcus citri TaxID=170843 RepID=UPI0031FA1BD8